MKAKNEHANNEKEIGKSNTKAASQPSDIEVNIRQTGKPEPLTEKYVSELLTSDKTSWNFIIPKKNVLTILTLALISWAIVGLIAFLIYRFY
ncbi:MAG: hypothetical protein WKF68_12000 [Daejeonella sp.]